MRPHLEVLPLEARSGRAGLPRLHPIATTRTGWSCSFGFVARRTWALRSDATQTPSPISALCIRPHHLHPAKEQTTVCKHYSTGCICPDCRHRSSLEAARRAACPACKGDEALCVGDQHRPLRCELFTAAGEVRPLVPVHAAQPWDTRKAA